MNTSFKVIPLDNISIHKKKCIRFIKNVRNCMNSKYEFFDESQYIKGIYSKSYSSDTIIPSSRGNVKLPWYMNTKHCIYTHVTFGKQFIDTYDPETKEKTSIVMTDKDIHVNGKKIHNPSMLVLPPGLFHRFITGNKGVSSIIINAIHNELPSENYENENEDKDKDKDVHESENELKLVELCEHSGKTTELDDYNDYEIENINPVHWKKLVHKWNSSAWII